MTIRAQADPQPGDRPSVAPPADPPSAHAEAPAGVSRRTSLARSGAATIGGQLASFAIATAATMVLARLLVPADFGRFAMVQTLILFISSFRDFGLPMAALQARELDHLGSSALFWVNLRVTIGVTLFMGLMGPALAWFYGEPSLVGLTLFMSLGVTSGALSNQHEAILTRRLRFGSLVGWDAGFLLVGSAAALGLAWAGAGSWALAAQFVIWQVGRAAAVWIVSGWLPARPGEVRAAGRPIGDLLSFGAYLTGYRVLAHAGRDLDRILVGYLGGASALGLYDAAFRWARLPIQQVYTPLLGVAVAGLSRARDDAGAFRRNARQMLGPLLALTVPALAYGALAGGPLIRVLLGPRWEAAVPMFRWLCVGSIALAALKTTKWLYLATGNTKRQFRWGLASFPVFAGAIAAGAAFGAEGVAVAFAASNWALLAPGLAYCLAGTPLGLGAYLGLLARPLAASAVAAGVAWGLGRLAGAGPLGEVLLTAPAFGLAYLAAFAALPGGRAGIGDALGLARSLRGGRAQTAAGQGASRPATM